MEEASAKIEWTQLVTNFAAHAGIFYIEFGRVLFKFKPF